MNDFKMKTFSLAGNNRGYKDHAREVNKEMMPTTIKIGKARDINPPTTIMIRLIGSSTRVRMNYEIPQAALMPKKNNFPKINNIHMANNNVNISLSFLLSVPAQSSFQFHCFSSIPALYGR